MARLPVLKTGCRQRSGSIPTSSAKVNVMVAKWPRAIDCGSIISLVQLQPITPEEK